VAQFYAGGKTTDTKQNGYRSMELGQIVLHHMCEHLASDAKNKKLYVSRE
jgi:hypothetical protein